MPFIIYVLILLMIVHFMLASIASGNWLMLAIFVVIGAIMTTIRSENTPG